jgi:hypothetical protein
MVDEVDPDIARQDTMQAVTDEMAAAGFVLPEPPDFPMPKLRAADLTSGDQARYGQTYVHFAAWASYSFKVLAYIDGWVEQHRAQLKRMGVKARLKARRLKLPGEKKSEKAIADEVEGNPSYMDVADKLQVLVQKRFIVNAQHEEAEVGKGVYSRYLPIRESEYRNARGL